MAEHISELEGLSHDEKIARYQDAVRTAHLAGALLAALPLGELLEHIRRADILGPYVDPTLWREKGGAMEVDRRVLAAALELVNATAFSRAAGG